MPPEQRVTDPTVPTLLLTARQAAQALAISERSLWQLTHDGLMPVVRVGRSVRYDPRDLREFIENQKAPSDSVSGRV